jgi:hypothetical protein
VLVPNSRKQEVTLLLILDQGFRNPTKPSSSVFFCFLGSIQIRYSKQIISVEIRDFKNTISEALYSLAVISPYKMSSHSSPSFQGVDSYKLIHLQRIASSGPKLHHQDSFLFLFCCLHSFLPQIQENPHNDLHKFATNVHGLHHDYHNHVHCHHPSNPSQKLGKKTRQHSRAPNLKIKTNLTQACLGLICLWLFLMIK